MTDVFISYSRKDGEFVRRLHDSLHARNHDTWVDWQDIPLTSEWWNEIQRGIDAAQNFIFVISPDSVTSPVCTNEVQYAVETNKRLIPVVRREVPPTQMHKALARHNWLFFREEDDFDKTFAELLRVINLDLKHVQAHTRLNVRAREWEARGRNPSLLLRGDDLHEAETWLAQSGSKDPKPTEAHTAYIIASRRAASARQRVTLGAVSVALVAALILTVFAFYAFSVAETRRQESDLRGTAVAQNAATAVAAQATAERSATIANSLALAASAGRAIEAENTDLALALALQANDSADPPTQARYSLISAAYAPGTRHVMSGGHGSWVMALDVSADGRWYLSGGLDGTLALWDAETGEQLQAHTFPGEAMEGLGMTATLGSVNSIDFSPLPEQANLAALGLGDGSIVLWDVAAWQEIRRFERIQPAQVVLFSPDGEMIASGHSGTRNNLFLWAVADGDDQPVQQFNGHEDQVTSLAFSRDGRRLLTGSWDATVRLWNVRSGRELNTYGPITNPTGDAVTVVAAVFNPTQTRALISVNFGAIFVYDLETGRELQNFATGYSAASTADMHISPDGDVLATATYDSFVYLWEVETGRLIRRLIGHEAPLSRVRFAPDGVTLVSASQDMTLREWYVNGGAQSRVLRGYADGASAASLVITADGTRAISGGGDADPVILLWDLATGEVIRRMEGHDAGVIAMDLSDDERLLLSGAWDGTARLWDVETGEMLVQITLDALAIPGVDISPDGTHALIAAFMRDMLGGGQVVYEYDLTTGEEMRQFVGHSGPVLAAAYSPDGSLILTGGGSLTGRGEAILWDAASGAQIRTFDGVHTSAVDDVVFSQDGRLALTAGQDFLLALWEVATGAELYSFVGHSDVARSVIFSPDEQTIISASFDDTVRLWDVATGTQILALEGHSNDVFAVAYRHGTDTLLSSGRDGQIIEWEVALETDAIRAWLPGHRFVRELTCLERRQYNVTPLCP